MHTPHRDSLIDSSDPQYSGWYHIFKTTKAIRRLLWLDYAPWHLGPTNYPEQWRSGPAWNYRAIFGNSSRRLLRSSRLCSWDIVFNWSTRKYSMLWLHTQSHSTGSSNLSGGISTRGEQSAYRASNLYFPICLMPTSLMPGPSSHTSLSLFIFVLFCFVGFVFPFVFPFVFFVFDFWFLIW